MKSLFLTLLFSFIIISKIISEPLTFNEFESKYREAAILYGNEQYEPALEIFNVLCDDTLSKRYPSVFLSKALALYSLKRYPESKVFIEKCIDLQPYTLKPIFYRSVINTALKDYDCALADINYCLEKNSSWADAYHQKGLIYLNRQDYDLALENFNNAISNNSDIDAGYYSDRGFSKYFLSDYESAKKDFLISLKYAINDDVYLCLIDICYKLKQYEEGMEYASILINKKSHVEEAIINRAYILLVQEQYEAVKNDLEQIRSECLKLSSYHKLYCVYYILTDQTELAFESIKTAKALNENDKDIKILVALLEKNDVNIKEQIKNIN